MTIRKKSREELRGQALGFLDYSVDLGKITKEKKKEIMEVLRNDSVDVFNKDELKDKLSGIVPEIEFDGLWRNYYEYGRLTILQFKKYIEELKILPEGYDFLSKDLAIYLLRNGYNLNDFAVDFKDLSSDEIEETCKNISKNISKNINILKTNLGISNADLGKFMYFIYEVECDKDIVTGNIKLFKEAGINKIDDFVKLQILFNSEYTGNIKLFLETGIKSVDEILELTKNGLLGLDMETIKLFISLGAHNLEDFIRLKKLVFSSLSFNLNDLVLFKRAGVDNIDDVIEFSELFCRNYTTKDNITFLVDDVGIKGKAELLGLKEIILSFLGTFERERILMLSGFGIKDSKNLIMLKDIIYRGDSRILQLLGSKGIKDLTDLMDLKEIIINGNYDRIKFFIEAGNENKEKHEIVEEKYIKIKNIMREQYPDITQKDLILLCDILSSDDLRISNLEIIFKIFGPINLEEIKNYKNIFLFNGDLPSNLEFYQHDKKISLGYIEKFLDMSYGSCVLSYEDKLAIISNIVKLSLSDVEKYLYYLDKVCISGKHSYAEFLECFDGKSFHEDAFKYLCRGFDIGGFDISCDQDFLNSAISTKYPGLNIQFSNDEAEEILGFIDSVGGVNKGYTILILTMEKMVRDGVSNKDFNNILLKKLENYKKVFDMYPESKIPEGLRVSVGLEFEMTRLYIDWYRRTTGNDYYTVVNSIVKNAKVGIENEGAYEFATNPSTNPMVALLEIYLLQELNLLDINDMQKLSGNIGNARYASRNGTGYHLNIGSDSDIGVDENVQFIQNLCTILPRGGISNGDSIRRVNPYASVNSKSSKFSVFPNAESKKYVELRTYNVDDVELFEKNILFNTYSIMGSQAQKKYHISYKTVMELRDKDQINNSEDLVNYLENNNFFKKNYDLKTKKVATEFIWMQISVLRAISEYNKNFLDNELFGEDLLKNLSGPWKDYLLDFFLSDKKETIGFEDRGQSSMVVKRYAVNLSKSFEAEKYMQKSEPFSDEETEELLNESGDSIDKKRIPYVTKWINKRLLWARLCEGCADTQDLEDRINNKISNVDRIKSYIRGESNDANLKIDIQYLRRYFKENMSLVQVNPYHGINTDFVNKIINLNNFFLKKDDANANGVMQTTILNGDKDVEQDISKSSIFETGYMRKGYNYYQGGSENMLLHVTQKIALDYMENVKNILNTDFDGDIEKSVLKEAA